MHSKYAGLKETALPGVFAQWQEVEAEIYAVTDLGLKVMINGEYTGLAYGNETYGDYREGQKLKAYIKGIRADGRIDVSLQPRPDRHIFATADKILAHLRDCGGTMELSDTSSPQEIRDRFQISKKVFKQVIGRLYKQRKIKITHSAIELIGRVKRTPSRVSKK